MIMNYTSRSYIESISNQFSLDSLYVYPASQELDIQIFLIFIYYLYYDLFLIEILIPHATQCPTLNKASLFSNIQYKMEGKEYKQANIFFHHIIYNKNSNNLNRVGEYISSENHYSDPALYS